MLATRASECKVRYKTEYNRFETFVWVLADKHSKTNSCNYDNLRSFLIRVEFLVKNIMTCVAAFVTIWKIESVVTQSAVVNVKC